MLLNPPKYTLIANGTPPRSDVQPFSAAITKTPKGDPVDSLFHDQRSSSWIVAIVSFNEPAAMLDQDKGTKGVSSKNQPTTTLNIIYDELLGVSVQNPKSSFAKMATIQVKPIMKWYPSLIAPGDWAFIWMADDRKVIEKVRKNLKELKDNGVLTDTNALCNEKSGLKFAGRVLKISTTDSTHQSGQRTVSQQIDCQAFMEFATSVYYTYSTKAFIAGTQKEGAPDTSFLVTQAVQQNTVSNVLGNIAETFINFYRNPNQSFSPDDIIGNYYATIMGTDIGKLNYGTLSPERATANTQITVPDLVACILGNPSTGGFTGPRYLWEMIETHLGMQQFGMNAANTLINPVRTDNEWGSDPKESQWYKSFQPDFDENVGAGILRTPHRTKGFVPYRPALWDGQSMWSIFSQYLNDIVNEIYTVLRVNSDGLIVPTFVVREKPFSTGLFAHYLPDSPTPDLSRGDPPNSTSNGTSPPSPSPLLSSQADDDSDTLSGSQVDKAVQNLSGPDINARSALNVNDEDLMEVRTFFGNLPRWVVDPSMIKDYSYSIEENSRVNFVQVWGTSDGLQFASNTMSNEQFKAFQFSHKNWQADYPDIERHGLRSLVVNSQFDLFVSGETITWSPAWASMLADWTFNGHLKAKATLRLLGVTAPICEGDNCEVDGVVYHIESVTHAGSISGGAKIFETTLQLSNGIKASTLDDSTDIPQYVCHFDENREFNTGPGFTVITSDGTDVAASRGDTSLKPAGDAAKIVGQF